MQCFVNAFFIFFTITMTFGQYSDSVPKDLDQKGIVFLKYEQLHAADSLKKLKKKYKIRNKWAEEANLELATFAKKYPYKYVVEKRQESYDSLIKAGYSYVLNCDIMDLNNAGVDADPFSTQLAPLYIQNLETLEVFDLLEWEQSGHTRGYNYEKLLELFLAKVKQR